MLECSGFGGHVPEGARDLTRISKSGGELMAAGLRLVMGMLAAVLALGPTQALAQSTAPAATNAPAADAIGPRELQNFSLPGTVTRPSDPSPEPTNSTPPRSAPTQAMGAAAASERGAPTPPPLRRSVQAERPAAASAEPIVVPRSTPPAGPVAAAQRPSLSSITVDIPPARVANAAAAAPSPGFADGSAADLAPDGGISVWPWLLVAASLGAGAAFLFFRRHSREVVAGGPPSNAFPVLEGATRPTPARPRPAPPPPVATPPVTPPQLAGIVATRIRPWLEAEFEPHRCVVEDERVTFEFELDLVNSGSAPARDVQVAIEMFNASPTQDQEVAAFFANPPTFTPVPEMPPFKRFELRPRVVVASDKLRILEAGGRRLFVPLVAINVLYRWGKGDGQTAAAFLLGRDTAADKLAPFRVDLGTRVYRTLGTRILPGNIRR